MTIDLAFARAVGLVTLGAFVLGHALANYAAKRAPRLQSLGELLSGAAMVASGPLWHYAGALSPFWWAGRICSIVMLTAGLLVIIRARRTG